MLVAEQPAHLTVQPTLSPPQPRSAGALISGHRYRVANSNTSCPVPDETAAASLYTSQRSTPPSSPPLSARASSSRAGAARASPRERAATLRCIHASARTAGAAAHHRRARAGAGADRVASAAGASKAP